MITPQFDNKILSSFLLWADNTLLGQNAFTNFSGNFYKLSPIYNGLYTYGLPFKQINADQSIVGANIMSGVYLNDVFIRTGQSGLVDINYQEGHAYFSQSVDTYKLSGQYSVKDFNIYLTNEPEWKLLFETKFETRPKIARDLTGLAPQTMTFPAIFIKKDASYNEPFQFGGTKQTFYTIRAVILADSHFALDAVTSLFRDQCEKYIGMVGPTDMPFNAMGGSRGGYSYSNLAKTPTIWISKVRDSRLSYQSVILNEMRNLNPGVFASLVDFEAQVVRD